MSCEMARREFYIEKEVCKYAVSLGWRQRKMEFVGRRGCPDRWFKRDGGQLVIIEFKDPNGALSAAQRREVNWLTTHGFNVHVVDSIQQGREIFDAWETGTPRKRKPSTKRRDPENLVRWPDGTEATLGEVLAGDFDWKSDDYEVIPFEDQDD